MPFWHEQGSGMDRLTAMEVFVRIIDTVREAEANLGIAITPDWFVLREIEDGRLKAIQTEYAPPPSEFNAVYPSARHVSAKVRAFSEFLRAEFQEIPTLRIR